MKSAFQTQSGHECGEGARLMAACMLGISTNKDQVLVECVQAFNEEKEVRVGGSVLNG